MNETPAAIPEIKYPTPPSRNWWRVLYHACRLLIALAIAGAAGWPMWYFLAHSQQEIQKIPQAAAWLLGGILCLLLSIGAVGFLLITCVWLSLDAIPRLWARLKEKAGVE